MREACYRHADGQRLRVAIGNGARILGRFLAASLAVKVVLLALDSQPRFFLGDSESYLTTELGQWVPADRSWLFGSIAVPLVRLSGSLAPLLWAHALIGALVCATVGTVAMRRFAVSRRVAWLLVIALTIEPLSLYCERFVLTDTIGLALFWASTVLLIELADRPAVGVALALAAATTLAVALRTIFLPHAVLLAAICAWFGFRAVVRARDVRGAAVCVGAAVLVLAGLRTYAVLTGALLGTEPAVNPRSGYFLSGVVAPLLTPADLDGLGVRNPPALLAATWTHEWTRRNWQTFGPEGLGSMVEREVGSSTTANRALRAAASRAVIRDPLGFARIAWRQAREYANERVYRREFKEWRERPLPESLVQRLQGLTGRGIDPERASAPSLTSEWLRVNLWAAPALFIAALVLSLLLFPLAPLLTPQAAHPLRILCLVTLSYVVTIAALSLCLAARFLLPIVPNVAIMLAAAVGNGWRLLAARASIEP